MNLTEQQKEKQQAASKKYQEDHKEELAAKRCEDELIRHTREEIESAVRTEQICIELDALEIRRAA